MRLTATLAAILLLSMASMAGLFAYISICGYRGSAGDADAVVVLGAKVLPGGAPTPALAARTELGIRLWKEGRARFLVFTGGLGTNPPAEAEVMRRIALDKGVPNEAIIVEDRSHCTLESARLVGEIARSKGWTTVIVATDPFHTVRAGVMFENEGLQVHTEPTDDIYYNDRTRRFYTLREAVALAAYLVQRPFLR